MGNNWEIERKKQRERAMELWNGAEEITEPAFIDDKKLHCRYFLVRIYEENTETLGCLGFLEKINRWFKVKPLKKRLVEKIKE